MEDDGGLRISYAITEEEKTQVTEFVNEQYLRLFGTTPPVSDCYTVAWIGETIVGCIGVEFAPIDGLLPIERMYGLKRDRYPLPLNSANGMQYGRWLVVVPKLSPTIIYHATVRVFEEGRSYGLVEHNAAVHRAALRLGVRFWDLPEAKLDLAMVPQENRDYYAKHPMTPYLVDLKQIIEALRSK